MNKKWINEHVAKLTMNGDLKDLRAMAKAKNIDVIDCNLGSSAGYYFAKKRAKVIFINTNLSYYKKLIVLAHEIAHATLHPNETHRFTHIMFKKNNKENDANYLACELLGAIGFWENEMLCVYEHEMTVADKGFIEAYREYAIENNLCYN